MRKLFRLSVVLLMAGCGPAEEPPVEEAAPAATVSLTDLAGAWTVTGTAESSDSVLITYELTATGTTEGWTSTLPGREPMPLRVVLVDGDSVVVEAGPYESALRAGGSVTTRSVLRLDGEMLMGSIVARYDTQDADSLLVGRLHGMRRAP
jgi:hypothetical protein